MNTKLSIHHYVDLYSKRKPIQDEAISEETMDYIVRSGKKLIKNKDVFKIGEKWVTADKTVIDNYTGKRYLKNSSELLMCVDAVTEKTVYSTKTIYTEYGTTCASVLRDKRKKIFETLLDDHYAIRQPLVVPVNKNRNKSIYYFHEKEIDPPTKLHHVNESILNKYTYGFEIETANGEVSDGILSKYGFTTIYDGSISGHELVSAPLVAGALHNVASIVDRAKWSCSLNTKCSLHIHIGGVPRSKDNLIRLYDIYYKLQDELWLLIPYYKKEISYLKTIEKDYVKTLIKLNPLNVNNILAFFNVNIGFDHIDKLEELLLSNRKWTLSGRYHFINFLNYICKRSGTIEIRLLQSTFSSKLIETWLLINVLIIDFALNNNVVGSKTKIDLQDIIDQSDIRDKTREKLLANIDTIKNLYFRMFITKGNTDLANIDRTLDNSLFSLELIDGKT